MKKYCVLSWRQAHNLKIKTDDREWLSPFSFPLAVAVTLGVGQYSAARPTAPAPSLGSPWQ